MRVQITSKSVQEFTLWISFEIEYVSLSQAELKLGLPLEYFFRLWRFWLKRLEVKKLNQPLFREKLAVVHLQSNLFQGLQLETTRMQWALKTDWENCEAKTCALVVPCRSWNSGVQSQKRSKRVLNFQLLCQKETVSKSPVLFDFEMPVLKKHFDFARFQSECSD